MMMRRNAYKQTFATLAMMALAFELAHCAWIVGFESSYSVDPTADDGGGGGGEGGAGDAPSSDAPASDAASGDASLSFGDAVVVASGEATPFGGITVDNQSIYWTIGVLDAGVRTAGKDGGAATNLARANGGGTFQEIFALPGDTIYWRIGEVGCGANVGCGPTAMGAYGICGLKSRRLRTDGRRLYALAEELNTGKFPIHVVSKGCGSMATITRLDSEAGAGSPYVNIVPDLSGNRVFAVAGTAVDCLDVAGGPTVRVTSGNILDLVSDDTHLYWLTPSELHRCKLGSDVACSACTNDEVLTKTKPGTVASLLVDGSSLYWTAQSGISAIAKDAPAGTAATAVATNQASPVALAVDSSGVYWANAGDGTIMRSSRR
jgi:hypothetical protein